MTSAAGTVTDTLVFDAFGNETTKTGTSDNSYGFQGEEQDATGLYYLRARYMDPSTGTFTSMDTYSGSLSDPMSLHKYMFANSNPVIYSDPSGHFSAKEELGVIAIQGVLGAAVSGFMYRLDWIINDPGSERHSWGGFAWQVIYGFVYGALSAKLGFGLLGLNLSIYDYFIIAIISQIASLEIKDMAEVLGKQTGNPLVWGILNGIGDGTQVVSNAATSAVIVKGLEGLQNTKNSSSGRKNENTTISSSQTNSGNSSTILDDIMNRDSYRKYPIDCSEIAEDLYNAAGRKGQILHIEAQEGWLNVETYGISEAYSYHEVYSINGLIYDPRYSSTPVTKAEYFNMINDLNKGGFAVWTI
nr:RHS repeat-associated core domain-containing protein [Pseudobutyrivibrio sp.]